MSYAWDGTAFSNFWVVSFHIGLSHITVELDAEGFERLAFGEPKLF